jgi:hypothetical protein
MSGKANYHVTKKNGHWAAKREGAERASSLHSTQAAAERAAKELAKRGGGGEVKIHTPRGTIRDSDTVSPARDPFPPRDRKH